MSVSLASHFADINLTERSRAVMLLLKKLHTGQVAYSEIAIALWQMDPNFLVDEWDNVCSKLNKIKAEYNQKENK